MRVKSDNETYWRKASAFKAESKAIRIDKIFRNRGGTGKWVNQV